MPAPADPAGHALAAATMLAALAVQAEKLDALSAEERMELAALGQFRKINADLEWTAKLATAHALTSIALTMRELVDAYHAALASDADAG